MVHLKRLMRRTGLKMHWMVLTSTLVVARWRWTGERYARQLFCCLCSLMMLSLPVIEMSDGQQQSTAAVGRWNLHDQFTWCQDTSVNTDKKVLRCMLCELDIIINVKINVINIASARKCQHNVVFTARCYAERGIAMASCLSVCPSVRNVEVLWLHRLEIFKNNFMVS